MCRSGVVDVPFYTRCGGCPVWWMSGVVDVLFYPWCGGCLVWSMSGVVDVCVVDVIQSQSHYKIKIKVLMNFPISRFYVYQKLSFCSVYFFLPHPCIWQSNCVSPRSYFFIPQNTFQRFKMNSAIETLS